MFYVKLVTIERPADAPQQFLKIQQHIAGPVNQK